jgi:hypothetical protein
MENKQIAAIIQDMGMARLYRHESGMPKFNAQINLEGRNYFAADSTLKFFGSRISSAHETCSGLLFYIIESSFLDYNKTKRGFRYAFFDIFGEAVARLPIDDAFRTSEQARKAMWKELNAFDVAEHYKKALKSIAGRKAIEAEDAQEALKNLQEEITA